MKAITTKYLPATLTNAARYIAFDADGNRASAPADEHRINDSGSHILAVRALCLRKNWHGRIVRGELKPGVWVWVWTDKNEGVTV